MLTLPTSPPDFACVVAAERSLGIGIGSDLPWPRLRGDLAHFRRITSETRTPGRRNAVIMGRKTWESVPMRVRPLPGRLNIVMSRTPLGLPEGGAAATSLDQALSIATLGRVESIFVVGGAEIYALAFAHPGCRAVYLTRVDGDFPCDAFMPPLSGFVLDAADEPQADDGIGYRIERWIKAE